MRRIDNRVALAKRVCLLRIFWAALAERIVGVLRFCVSCDPSLSVSFVREARGGPHRGAELAQNDAVIPVMLNNDLIACWRHPSQMASITRDTSPWETNFRASLSSPRLPGTRRCPGSRIRRRIGRSGAASCSGSAPLDISRSWPLRFDRYVLEAPIPERLTSFVPRSQQLVSNAVEINSPGFWEFLGSVSPLEIMRNYLNDRHERRKDREYLESAEE